MTLAELLSHPPASGELDGLALVFSTELRDRLLTVQQQHGRPHFTAHPAALSDGRWMHQASILEECRPGGLYYDGFAMLDAGRFSEIAVIPLSEAVALLPAVTPPA